MPKEKPKYEHSKRSTGYYKDGLETELSIKITRYVQVDPEQYKQVSAFLEFIKENRTKIDATPWSKVVNDSISDFSRSDEMLVRMTQMIENTYGAELTTTWEKENAKKNIEQFELLTKDLKGGAFEQFTQGIASFISSIAKKCTPDSALQKALKSCSDSLSNVHTQMDEFKETAKNIRNEGSAPKEDPLPSNDSGANPN
jgi:hypothetical protein